MFCIKSFEVLDVNKALKRQRTCNYFKRKRFGKLHQKNKHPDIFNFLISEDHFIQNFVLHARFQTSL